MRASDWLWALASTNVALPMRVLGLPGWPARNCTSWPDSGYGSGLSRTALTTVKMAVFAPMPSASVSTATAVKPGFFSNWRKANFKSFMVRCQESVVRCLFIPHSEFRIRSLALENDEIRMTNVERMSKHQLPENCRCARSRRFGFQISEFFRHWAFVIHASRLNDSTIQTFIGFHA